MSAHPSCYLLEGQDQALVSQGLSRLLDRLEQDLAPGVIAEHFSEPGGEDDYLVAPIIEACTTPPFLSAGRLIVVRDADRLGAAAERELATYLTDPLETTTLVLVFAKKPSAALLRQVRTAGEVIEAVPEARGRAGFVSGLVAQAPVRLDPKAEDALVRHLGEAVDRLEGILGALEAAYGTSTTIGLAELEPFLGEAGGLAPWDLTDAIDNADAARALEVLERLLHGGGRHALQVMASLHRHFGAMLCLDGRGEISEGEAATATGLSPYPAKKALRRARSLGHERLVEAIALLARADLDLRGESALAGEVVMEVLVARLSRLGAPARRKVAATRTRSQASRAR